MLSILLAQKIVQLLLVMVFGFAIVKSGLLKSGDSIVLSRICLYIIVPCLILNIFQTDLKKEIMEGLFVCLIAVLLLHIAAIATGVVFKRLFHANVVEEMSVVYPNAGNLIVPLISHVLGEEWLVYATAYMAVQIVFFWTHCVHRFSGEKKTDLKKILLNVNILSILAGIVLMVTGLRLPGLITGVMSSVGDMIGPISMLVAGMLAANLDWKSVFLKKRIYLVFAFKMLIFPIIALLLVKGVGRCFSSLAIDPDKVLLVSFLPAIAPSASTVVQFSQVYGQDAEYASAINIMTLLGCVVTMPVFVYLYELL